MRYKVWDIEDNKERTLSNCVTVLGEVGTVRKVVIKKGIRKEEHHFKILEVLND